MIELRLFGRLSLTSAAGRDVRALLGQPRRLALLAYLAAATPPGFHRRDSLLALFWPELDQEHARAALRQALHVVRDALGTNAVASRGDEEIGLDFDRASCDVTRFRRAVEGEQFREALELYRGDLLEGFFITGAPEFERWLETERARLREIASRTARTLGERCEAERELAHGRMATVFLAHDLKHGRPVAIKVLHPELAAAVGTTRFLREIGFAAQLHHPHIVPLHDSGEQDGLPYFVRPYVEGESLRDRLEREPQLPVPEALRIADDVAKALGYAHTLGVVHRDIKPENILLENGHALVADFGIARAISAAGSDRLTETGIALGTPAYMSPEQAVENGPIDGRADLYALGCVVYEMLAGTPPFTGPTAQAVLARHAVDPVAPIRTVRETVPRGVEQAVLKALAKVPADRYAGPPEVAQALNQPALEPAPGGRLGKSRGAKLALGAGLSAAATLALLGGVSLGRGREGPHPPDPLTTNAPAHPLHP